jgi:hypothetical protein
MFDGNATKLQARLVCLSSRIASACVMQRAVALRKLLERGATKAESN